MLYVELNCRITQDCIIFWIKQQSGIYQYNVKTLSNFNPFKLNHGELTVSQQERLGCPQSQTHSQESDCPVKFKISRVLPVPSHVSISNMMLPNVTVQFFRSQLCHYTCSLLPARVALFITPLARPFRFLRQCKKRLARCQWFPVFRSRTSWS